MEKNVKSRAVRGIVQDEKVLTKACRIVGRMYTFLHRIFLVRLHHNR